MRERSVLFLEGIIREVAVNNMLEPGNHYESLLTVVPEYVDHLKSGRVPRPDFGPTFPAVLIETAYEWDDVVLHLHGEVSIHRIIPYIDYDLCKNCFHNYKGEEIQFDVMELGTLFLLP